MAALKEKGDLAELKVAADLASRGCRLAFPWGENCDYDLIADTGDRLHRIQVKYTESDGAVIKIECRSRSLTRGRVIATKHYTAETVDWMAVYDRTTDECYYVPALELGEGRTHFSLRLAPTLNLQRAGIRFAADHKDFPQRTDPRV